MERKHKFLMQRLAEFVFEKGTQEIQERVQAAVQILIQKFPRNSKQFLDCFEASLKKVYAKKFAIVEFAGTLDMHHLKQLLSKDASLSKCELISKECPELMGGFKIKNGDNVLDFSIKSQLNALINNLK